MYRFYYIYYSWQRTDEVSPRNYNIVDICVPCHLFWSYVLKDDNNTLHVDPGTSCLCEESSSPENIYIVKY